jgi:glutamyl-tRNA synthetase
MAEQAAFYLRAPAEYEAEATARFWTAAAADRYALLIERLAARETMDPEALELLYRGLAAELGVKLVELAQLTRTALTGKAASPPIFQVMSILGKTETIARLQAARSAAMAAGRRS